MSTKDIRENFHGIGLYSIQKLLYNILKSEIAKEVFGVRRTG